MDMLGRAKSVKVQKENTVIVDGEGDKEAYHSQESHRSRSRSKRPLLISTERSCRRDWLSCPAVLQLSV